MPNLNLHKIGGIHRKVLSPKARARKVRRGKVEIAAKKLEFSLHANLRYGQRFSKKEELTIRKNIINGIVAGQIKHNKGLKCYKIYGSCGVYILGENLVVITVMSENIGSKADKYYLPISGDERKMLLDVLGVNFYSD